MAKMRKKRKIDVSKGRLFGADLRVGIKRFRASTLLPHVVFFFF